MTTSKNIPYHVAIIPDGNRRWAAARGEKPWIGHDMGAQRIEEIAHTAREMGVKYLSLWGSSFENLTKRPLQERKALYGVYDTYFDRLLGSEDIMEHQVRINVIGRWREQLPQKLCTKIAEGVARTAQHKNSFLTFFIAYSGDDDMLSAVQKITASGTHAQDVTKETIKAALMTHALPPVDYMIRTGGEPHLSTGFMMWDTANAQLYFTQALFPDFDAGALRDALAEYARRARRHGA